ncbi:transmembrane amino acid transporter protein [Sarocladium implicatum]|nr:transmembrane amino acid transporter protein [Sarocladium implicatum]
MTIFTERKADEGVPSDAADVEKKAIPDARDPSPSSTLRGDEDGTLPMRSHSGVKEGHVEPADGNILGEGDKPLRNMGRWDTSFVLITNQVGIGILSLPGSLQTLGIVPGVIAIIGLGLLSTYTAYEMLQFQQRHPHCLNFVDMCRVVGGRPFEAVGAIVLLLSIMFTCASATVTMSIGLNSISDHGACTVAFMAVSAIGCWLLCLPRTFKFVARVGVPAAIAVLAAVLIVMISLGVADPSNAPSDFSKKVNIVGNPTFREGLSACLRICYAYAGNVGFPSVIAEMKDPAKDFVPSLVWLQTVSIPLYIIVAVAIYCMAGQYTTSPALGSAPTIPAKAAYGIMLFALLSTGMVFGHTAIKWMFVFLLRRMNSVQEVTKNTFKSWASWVACASVFWLVVFIVAAAVPVFNSILSISSATMVAWTTFGISAVLWFHLNWHQLFKNWKKISLTIVNALIIIQTLFMNSAGMWTAVTQLLDIFNDPEQTVEGAFTCADNSIF